MTEKNILAYFKTPDEAEKAKQQLETIGMIDMSINEFGRYPGDGVEQTMNPLTGNVSSLAELTLDADASSKSAGILMAVDNSASGMSDGGDGGPTGYNHLLTVVVEERKFNQAMQVIESCGGKT